MLPLIAVAGAVGAIDKIAGAVGAIDKIAGGAASALHRLSSPSHAPVQKTPGAADFAALLSAHGFGPPGQAGFK